MSGGKNALIIKKDLQKRNLLPDLNLKLLLGLKTCEMLLVKREFNYWFEFKSVVIDNRFHLMDHFLKFPGWAPFAPLLATPESKSTLLENDVTKGQSTIMEDNENVPKSSNMDKSDADFISIDQVCLLKTLQHTKFINLTNGVTNFVLASDHCVLFGTKAAKIPAVSMWHTEVG